MKQNYEKEEKIELNPVGLVNLSRYQKVKNYKSFKKTSLFNSCYMNASIQCLFRMDRFINTIIKYDGGSLVSATKQLIYDMQQPNNNQCSVIDIKNAMGEKEEKYNEEFQEDANEFITNYLNYLIEETRDFGKFNWYYKPEDGTIFNKFHQRFLKRNGNSFIIDLFYGVFRTEYYCKKCKCVFNIKFSSFNILEIPVIEKDSFQNNESLNIKNLIENFISEKDDIGEICSRCRITIKIKTCLYSLPKCLIIYFNKDDYRDNTNKINISKTINMENYVYDKSLIQDNDYYYNLKGIIFYSKYSSKVGHYKAACFVNKEHDEKWYYFDDNNVKTDKNLLRIYDDENPYLLFYEK